jgi:hypothetical protein
VHFIGCKVESLHVVGGRADIAFLAVDSISEQILQVASISMPDLDWRLVLMVADLDRPQEGFLSVRQEPLAKLRQSLK